MLAFACLFRKAGHDRRWSGKGLFRHNRRSQRRGRIASRKVFGSCAGASDSEWTINEASRIQTDSL